MHPTSPFSSATPAQVIGQPLPRVEGRAKVTGSERFAADIVLPGMLWGKVLRSPYAHARIVRIDTRRARALPGVHAVLTGADLPPDTRQGRRLRDLPVLATERVRFVGDKVAAVAADLPDLAEEALSLIEVEYEPLPAVFDPLEAIRPEAPLLHPDLQRYRVPDQRIPDIPNVCSWEQWRKGDVQEGFRQAVHVFEDTFRTPAQHQVYLEPHSCLVRLREDGMVDVWASNKAPYLLKGYLAATLGLPERVFAIHLLAVGGDFGGKGSPMDIPIAYFLAQATGRPVRITMTYTEELMAANPRHGAVVRVKLGLDAEARLVACQTQIYYNSGAYAAMKPSETVGLRGAEKGGGSYDIPHVQIDAYQVYTNTVPCGHMRSPGEPQVVFAVESLVDIICRELCIDPVEFRLRNVIKEGGLSPIGERYHLVQAEETIRRAAAISGWGTPKLPHVGRGIAMSNKHPHGGVYHAELMVEPDGTVEVMTAITEVGTGAHTVLRQIVAERLDLPPERITVRLADTTVFPYDRGVGGSRVTQMVGGALLNAAEQVLKPLREAAADLLGCPVDAVEYRERRFFAGRGREAVSWEEAARRATERAGGPLRGAADYRAGHFEGITAFHVQVAEVEVDPETGQVRVRAIYTADDVGRVLNPLGHRGQIEGNIAQAVSAALLETLAPDEDGKPRTLNLGEYKIPTMMDAPPLVVSLVESPTGLGPYHAKAIGEGPNSPLPAAIANAVYDACGVRIKELPITAEKIWRGLRARR
ncbi:MAG TPA: xanthine dehydrogenase family protein molybdopterin-binding subunit [Chloroflexota bacterium]|nr:xanthine dehydrogenase family protein molybdopterin-binding subunit [Chloroflexota bacterium]